jgi:hypothetical protein
VTAKEFFMQTFYCSRSEHSNPEGSTVVEADSPQEAAAAFLADEKVDQVTRIDVRVSRDPSKLGDVFFVDVQPPFVEPVDG